MRVNGDNKASAINRYLDGLRKEIRRCLEQDHKIDINSAGNLLESYFSIEYLPLWYFLSTAPSEIADHFVIMSQLLDANREYCTKASRDGGTITYFLNIGREYPGRLERIIIQNAEMGIGSFDSVKSRSGIRIIVIEKKGRKRIVSSMLRDGETLGVIMTEMRHFGSKEGCAKTEDFLRCLDDSYLTEEINNPLHPRRIQRHLRIFESTIADGRCIVRIENTSGEIDGDRLEKGEIRLSVGVMNPGVQPVIAILDCIKKKGISLNRSYYDLFHHPDLPYSVGIVSLYMPGSTNIQGLEADIKRALADGPSGTLRDKAPMTNIEERLEDLVRDLSNPGLAGDKLHHRMKDLKDLIRINTDLSDKSEIGDLLLNSFSDFMEGLEFLGLDKIDNIVARFFSFDRFDEFFVLSRKGGELSHKPGFRVKHNCLRGKAYKGGLRIDPIVKFAEVAALAFMMTWKCARSRILFGGGKGGMVLNPRDFDDRIDFFDTLASFGRSLFLVTGPTLDVPAGDVGCGPAEIGDMFEGFKSALRDLALLASGVKKGLSAIGNNVISVEEARTILSENFDIDPYNMRILNELITSEQYLELVVAPQITGKPRMGIGARAGATGRVLCYSILAMTGNLYLKGDWIPNEPIMPDEHALLKKAASVTEGVILENRGLNLITDAEWRILTETVYPKLLKNKKIVVQGTGKVGGSLLQELKPYGVNVIAVADGGGALIGDHLDVDELLSVVRETSDHPDRRFRSSVVSAEKNVIKRIIGAGDGACVLEIECDILVPAALENAITIHNAERIKAKIIACGSNGPNTSKAETILNGRGITIIYDFLANQGGVNASYFEWLRNLTERFRYEAEEISRKKFDPGVLDGYIMPEFRERIKGILLQEESSATTAEWNKLLRDINFAAVNEDKAFADRHALSMKTAGYVNTQLRLLAAYLLKPESDERVRVWAVLDNRVRSFLRPFMEHPEATLHNAEAAKIFRELYG